MTEDKYRVTRKPIGLEELSDHSNSPVDNSHDNTGIESQANYNNPIAQSESGIKIQGIENAPPQFMEAMKSQQSSSQPQAPQPQPQPQVPQQQFVASNPSVKSSGEATLDDLIRGLYPNGQIFEEVTLPSMGRFYDGTDGPADGKLHVRKMTGQEESILSTSRLHKKGVAMDMILKNCINEKFDTKNLLSEDRTYLFIYLRGISYSSDYDVELRCPDTDNTFTTTIDLNDLYVTKCPDNFGPEDLHGVMPESKYKFKYRPSRGRDDDLAHSYLERMAKNFDRASEEDDTLLYKTSLLLDNIEGLTDKTQLLYLLKKLSIADSSYVRNVSTELPFGVNVEVNVVSPYTNQDFKVELPFESNFFFPKLRKAN